MTDDPKLYRLMDLGGGTMRMVSVENPAWHSTYDGEWVRWDEVGGKLADEHLSLRAASEFIRDVHEAVHGVRPGQEDVVNLIELAKAVQNRVAGETPASPDELLDLARFRILDKRNGSEEAKDRLLGQMADEIERMRRASVDGHCRQCACDDCSRFYREVDRD